MPASFYLFAGCIQCSSPVKFPRFRVGKGKSKKSRKTNDNDNQGQEAPKLMGKPSLDGLSCSGSTDSTESLTSTTSSYSGSLTIFPPSPASQQQQTFTRTICFTNSILDNYSNDESICADSSDEIDAEIPEATIELIPAEPFYFMNMDDEVLELQPSTSNSDDWGYYIDFTT